MRQPEVAEAKMHIIFGTFRGGQAEAATGYEQFRRGVEKLFGAKTTQFGNGATRTGLMGHGRLSGAARDGDSYLVLLGAVHHPLPGWGDGSPLDDSDKTAAFLLRRYREQGLGFLDDTIGAFVVALWDAEERRFILANDPMGMRSAYYFASPDRFAFSSTLYALNCAVDGGLEIDRSLEDFLLGYEFLPWQQTLYKGVFSLAPGMILECRDGAVRQHTSHGPDCSAYRLENLARPDATDELAGEALFGLFMRCLQDVLPTDDRVAVLLGGFDSALIVAACRNLGKKVDSYSFRFPDTRFNQAFVEDLAQFCGAKHHWVDICPQVLQDGLSEYPLLFNQPSGMFHYLVETAHVLRQMRADGHNYCLSGDGCDELFLGYPNVFKRARFFLKYRSVPGWFASGASWILRQRLVEILLGHLVRFLRNFLNIAGRPMPRRGHISNRILDEHSLMFLRKDFPRQAMDPEAVLASLSIGLEGMSPLRLAYHGKSMPGLNRAKNMGATTASGLTLLSPYQHPALVSFVQSLPEAMLRRPKVKRGDLNLGKWLLMRVAEKKGLLPRKIIYQKKDTPVAGMADYWYMGPMKEFILLQMDSLPFVYDAFYVRNLLDSKFAENLFRRKFSAGSFVLKAPALLVTYAAFNNRQCKGFVKKRS
jgi:asparagine synthetase B (glutamine-hydrolysing)